MVLCENEFDSPGLDLLNEVDIGVLRLLMLQNGCFQLTGEKLVFTAVSDMHLVLIFLMPVLDGDQVKR